MVLPLRSSVPHARRAATPSTAPCRTIASPWRVGGGAIGDGLCTAFQRTAGAFAASLSPESQSRAGLGWYATAGTRQAASEVDGARYLGKAVVAGSGPAGVLMAIFLANMGWQVDVLEARDKPEYPQDVRGSGGRNGMPVAGDAGAKPQGPPFRQSPGRDRSWAFRINERGMQALEMAGVEIRLEDVLRPEAVFIHTKDGKLVQQPPMGQGFLVRRSRFVAALIENAERLHPSAIRFHFSKRLSHIDLDRRVAELVPVSPQGRLSDGSDLSAATKSEVPYDLLVGADGVNSQTRKILEQQVHGFTVHQEKDGCSMMLCDCPLGLLADRRRCDASADVWDHSVHVFRSSRYGVSLILTGEPGDEELPARGACMMTDERLVELRRHGAAALMSWFPALGRAASEAIWNSMAEQEPRIAGISTRCSHLHGPGGVVLLGDAAHSMVVTVGLGCNVALESCAILAEVLYDHVSWEGKASPDVLDRALNEFTEERLDEVLCAVELSQKALGGDRFRPQDAKNPWFVSFLALKLANTLAPRLFPAPGMVMAWSTTAPMSQCLRVEKRQGLLAGLAIFYFIGFAFLAECAVDVLLEIWEQSFLPDLFDLLDGIYL